MTSLRQSSGQLVTYSRGAQSVAITAVAAHNRMQRIDPHGVATAIDMHDWLIDPADLILAGLAEPEEGDRITAPSPNEHQAGQVLIFEVLPPSQDAPAWRYVDPARQRLRVHTKLVDVQ